MTSWLGWGRARLCFQQPVMSFRASHWKSSLRALVLLYRISSSRAPAKFFSTTLPSPALAPTSPQVLKTFVTETLQK